MKKQATKIKQAMRRVELAARLLEQETAVLESLLIGNHLPSCVYPVKDLRSFAGAIHGAAITVQYPILEYLTTLETNDASK